MIARHIRGTGMKGTVIGFDPDTNSGAISGYDGQRYDFATQDWHGQSRPRHGDVVDFQAQGQRAHDIYLLEPEYIAPNFGQLYFSPSGRISRSQYWLRFFLPLLAVSIVLQVIIAIAAAAGNSTAVGVFYVIYVIFGLATLWPGIAVLIKRIHDHNKTGWLVLLPYVPLVALAICAGIGSLAGASTDAIGVMTIIFMVAFGLIGLWFFIQFLCMRGTIGANRFGPDPVR
jgi:uncharacterized membrane protein YhaH (DUF805 family)